MFAKNIREEIFTRQEYLGWLKGLRIHPGMELNSLYGLLRMIILANSV